MNIVTRLFAASSLVLAAGSASAVTDFTETFDTNSSGWLNEGFASPNYEATGGVGNSGYISVTESFNSGPGGFGDPLRIFFRGNNGSASGNAFAGNWIADGVQTLSVAIRHDYTTDLNLYTRLNSGMGAAASQANDAIYAVAPDTWTTITFSITDSNPPFASYGAGSFNGVFSNLNDLQIGLYLPANVEFTDLTVDLDNVTVTVPEPTSLGLVALGALGVLSGRRHTR